MAGNDGRLALNRFLGSKTGFGRDEKNGMEHVESGLLLYKHFNSNPGDFVSITVRVVTVSSAHDLVRWFE